jgi:hypothetical protein
MAQETVRTLDGVVVIFNVVEVSLLPNDEYGKTAPPHQMQYRAETIPS